MSDELKSAWELALEKLDAQESGPVEKLSEDQKQEIAELRRVYKARIAERELHTQGRVREAVSKGAFDQIEALQRGLVQERRQLEAQLEEKVEAIRKADGST
jgi:hypothetical protein